MKAHALTTAMHYNVDRAGHVVFGVVETTAEAVRASLMDECRLRGLTGGSRTGGVELVAGTARTTVVCVAAGPFLVALRKRHPAAPGP